MKKLTTIHHSSAMHWVGNGFPVRSVFDYNGLGRQLSPFLLLDYAAPYQFPPGKPGEQRGVGAHPHKGFETVTVVYQGELEHRDSGGGGGKIGPGDVQWMTAGKGIIHQEFHAADFTQSGGEFHMVQLWVNLRAADKSAAPRYQTLLNDDIPVVTLPDDAGQVRVIAGDFDGKGGVAETFSPINLWDLQLSANKKAELTLPEGHTASFLVLKGRVKINDEETHADEGDLAIFEKAGTRLLLEAQKDSTILFMGGEPFDEPIAAHGPFVMNTQEEIRQAFQQYERGDMGQIN